jgi:ferredoxin hydrogenase small subunit
MEKKLPYQYEEKPTSSLIDRRSFLKVTGIITAVIAIGGYAVTDVFKKRNKYIIMRQKGIYKDDQRLQSVGLAASFENPAVKKFYKDLAGCPLSKTAKELLHTNYVVRTNLKIKGGANVC